MVSRELFRAQGAIIGWSPRREPRDGARGEVSEGPVDARDAGGDAAVLRAHRGQGAGARPEPGGLPDVGSGGVLAEVSVAAAVRAGRARARRRFGRDAAGEPSDAVRDRAGAVGRAASGAPGRAGPAGAAPAVQASVRAGAARRGSEGLRVAGRPASAVGGRHGALLVADGALRELLREGARGRRPGVLPPVAVRGAGASEALGGSARGSAGADPEQDGATKNDCERNAAKRLPTDLRREHPRLPLLVAEDGLASNGPAFGC